MIIKICNKCKCLILYNEIYCSKCKNDVLKEKEIMKKNVNKKYNKLRDEKYNKFYCSKDWRNLKSKYLQDIKYKCECCGKIATQVHHIIEIQIEEGWKLRLKYKNLKGLCLRCHNKEHGRFFKK